MQQDQKFLEYAKILSEKISEVFEEGGGINFSEFKEGDNLNQFLHALATVAPNVVYGAITTKQINHLQFNHMANYLTFRYSKVAEQPTEN